MSWQTVPLGELAVSRGGSVNPAKFPDETFELFSIPAYDDGAAEVCPGSSIGSSKKCVEENDVLISRIVPHIRRSWVVGPSKGYRQIASGEWIQFRSSDIFPEYLRHFLMSDPFHGQFMRTVSGVGGSLLRARPAEVYKIPVPIPPLEEQKRIAKILDAADALRAKRRESLAQLDALLQSTFLDLFGDPKENPKGWERCVMGEIIKFRGGSQPPKSTFTYEPGEGKVRLVQIRDFKSDRYLTFIPEELAKRQFEIDDVMIARYGPPVFQILRGLSGSYNVALMKAEPLAGLKKSFIYHLLSHPYVNDAVVAQSQRTAGQTGVNLKFLNDFPAYKPPLELQEKFEELDAKISQEKAAIEAHLGELDMLFASLQHHAFSGEL